MKKSIILSIIAIMIAVVFLTGCSTSKQETIITPGAYEERPADEVVSGHEEIVGDDHIIEDAYFKEADENGESVRLPRILIDSDDVNAINAKIEEEIQNTQTWPEARDYYTDKNGSILTVILVTYYDNILIDKLEIYYIDTFTGDVLEPAEFLARNDIQATDYDLKQIYQEEFQNRFEALLNDKNEAAVQYLANLEQKEFNLLNEKFYLDPVNDLHVYLAMPYMAGPEGTFFVDKNISNVEE